MSSLRTPAGVNGSGDARALSIVNWNVEWQPPTSRAAVIIRERIWAFDPDIVCLTEADEHFLHDSGHVITAQPDYGYPLVPGRQKGLLWSKQPWAGVDDVGHPEMPGGRFVAGQTPTPVGDLEVLGICTPWAAAHVSTGRRDRRRWQDHCAYLDALGAMLKHKAAHTIVVGDFNQMIPRRSAPPQIFEHLAQAILSRMEVATAGHVAPVSDPLIDHVAYTPDLVECSVASISRAGPQGEHLSDHVGVHVRLLRKQPSRDSLAPHKVFANLHARSPA